MPFNGNRTTGWIVIIAAMSVARASADISDLANRVPPGANSIAYINVKTLLGSKLGKSENWKEKLADAYASGPMFVPPNTNEVMMASWIAPATLRPVWEAAVLQLSTSPSMERIARDEEGFTDAMGGKVCAWAPINAYFLRLDEKMLGVLCPADRQFAARWVSQSSPGGDVLSTYLQSAVKTVDAKTDYLFAMDLHDAVSEKRVRTRLANDEFESLSEKKIDEAEVSNAVASIKGLRLTVRVDDHIAGKCAIEFGQPASPLSAFAKPLILELLDNAQAGLPDLQDWKFTVKGNSILGSGKLSNEGLRQLCSVIDPPSPTNTDEQSNSGGSTNEPKGETSEKDIAAASKRYFQAVAKMIDGFGTHVRGSSSMNQGATYVARDARRISRLPIVNVDPALVEWGTDTSSRLLEVASSMGVGGFKARARTASVMNPYVRNRTGYDLEVRADPNDAVDRQNAARERKAAAAEERAKVLEEATGVLKDIELSRAQIRTAMTQKYKIEF